MKKTNKHGDRWIYTPVIVQVAMVYGPFIVDLPIQIRVFVFFLVLHRYICHVSLPEGKQQKNVIRYESHFTQNGCKIERS